MNLLKKVIDKFEAPDIIALLLIICFSALIAVGKDGAIISMFMMLVGYYFGRRSK